MSYRTYINGHEWLGNNETSEIIFSELKRQGCCFDEEKCVREPFVVKDLDGLVKATERHLMNLFEKNPNALSSVNIFKSIKEDDNCSYTLDQLTLRIQDFRMYGYLFVSYMLLKYVGKEDGNWEFYWERDKKNKQLVCHYRLINDGKCIFTAH